MGRRLGFLEEDKTITYIKYENDKINKPAILKIIFVVGAILILGLLIFFT